MSRGKYYVGIYDNKRSLVWVDVKKEYVERYYRLTYDVLIGPFKTKRAAMFAARFPNSTCQSVEEYEIAAKYEF